MKTSMLEIKAADKIVRTCATVRAGETVVIVTDPTLFDVADKIAAAAYTAQADPVIAVMPPREWDGQEPSTAVAAAMRAADVVIFPTVKDIAHSVAMKEALQAGARAISMAGCGEDILRDPALEADFVAQRPICDRAADVLTRATTIRVTNPAGTDVTFSVQDRKGNAHACIVDRPGAFSGTPNIEANIAPVEGTAEGVIVFDASIPNLRTGILRDPVRLTVERGAVIRIEGGRDAKNLERLWAAQHDPNVYNIAQFAMGLNPLCQEADGGLVHDHGLYGSVHFGIGTSSNLGGVVKATGHIDGIMYGPTVIVDDVTILSHRTYALDRV
jgi:leucyl aminopeptidase (aminopeptidase T)